MASQSPNNPVYLQCRSLRVPLQQTVYARIGKIWEEELGPARNMKEKDDDYLEIAYGTPRVKEEEN